jgi:hypothetical protein
MLKLLPSFSVYFSYACNICAPPGPPRLGRLKMRARIIFAQILGYRCRGQTDFDARNVESSRTEAPNWISA